MSARLMSPEDTALRTRSRLILVSIALLGLVAGFILPTTGASAGQGSVVSGVVWADTNRDGLRNGGEPVRSGVTVQLLNSIDGAVVATTTTSAAGAYSFANTADGDYFVRVDAPGAFRFPDAVSGDNDFTRTGAPAAGQPERGATVPFAIAGATQVTGRDAGMQPISDLTVERLPQADACEGFAVTGGRTPFDATEGPGQDTGPANCIVRTLDTVSQQYSVSLTGLPTGASVPNVVVEFTISSPDGARLTLVGPGTNGIPAGCLAAANGANPPSSRTLNADGSITVTCNVGTMASNVAALQIAYAFSGSTPIPSHASITSRAYAGAGDAGVSNTVTGPEVEVTGAAEWDLSKRPFPSNRFESAGPKYTERTFDGVRQPGYQVLYQFQITDRVPSGVGGGELVWPATFTDVMPEFPGARILACWESRPDLSSGWSPWTLTCPIGEIQGTDGWDVSVRPNSGRGMDTRVGYLRMDVFIPLAEMNRAIDPAWEPGDPTPTGVFDFQNRAEDTDTWTMNGGAPNYGNGQEPGFDGTGNNLATHNARASDSQWDLVKSFTGGPATTTRTINGQSVRGYDVTYAMTILDRAGSNNVAPWLDSPVTFRDRLTTHPGAHLIECTPRGTGDPSVAGGAATCETGLQPADGWDMSFRPDQDGFDRRRGDFNVRLFIPMDAVEGGDLCETTATLDLRNEAVGTDHWTEAGEPVNGTGFEPGWDGVTATGNNVAANSIRPSAGECGTLTGNKSFIRDGFTVNGQITFGGDTIQSYLNVVASNDRVQVDDMRMCDVFDVSVFRLDTYVPRTGGPGILPADYVIEYAIGPNNVDTQAGPKGANGQFPIERADLVNTAAGCRDHSGPWSTNPEADFGPDWRDRVNMVRSRPIDPAHVEVGPFDAFLNLLLDVRSTYNGGPNAGEPIPAGILLTNIGGWPTGSTGQEWGTVTRQMQYTGMRLLVAKSATPTQYLPGATVTWDLSVQMQRTDIGATMLNLQVVDTIPAGLSIDLPCTRSLLPPGVTLTYDAVARQATFRAGDVPITRSPNQWAFHINNGDGAPRLRLCTTVDSLAQPGDSITNNVLATATNSENTPTNAATIQIVGSGQMGIAKSVDPAYVASGDPYTWSLEWGNTSTVIAFQPPDLIDVLPWNGDDGPASGSPRAQYGSEYTGLAELTGPLAAPTYLRGATGAVPGTWYYTTANPSTLNHDPRDASNADPAAPGGLWRSAAEITDFADVTGVRFVSSESLPVQSRVRAQIPMVSTSNDLDNVYVNRAMIFSGTFANQPLLSNEPFVLMPGFTIGDLVWQDRNGNGRFDGAERGVPGVTVQVRNADGDVVATRVTDANGRWSAAALPAGEYTVHIPASMFAPGGPLADTVVRTVGSAAANGINEGADNNNTATPNPAATGLTSTPVTMSYEYLNQRLTGGNGPSGDDVAGLAGDVIPDEFTNFTADLALMPTPGIGIEKSTNGQDADAGTGPNVTVGEPVRWTYVVTNTGGVNLTGVTVTDDQVAAADIDCAGTGSNVVTLLTPGASVTCVATGTATLGQYENLGSVTGLDPTDVEVDDEDPSHYFGIEPSIDIEKATNGQDADTPTGPLVTVGGAVRWTYVVTNTGSVPLTNVTVVDDLVAAAEIDCDDTGSNVIAGPLASGESFTCVAEGTAVSGQYANLGAVTGTAPSTTDVDGNTVAGAVVADDDPSHYFGIEPSVDIEKATNGQDADTPTGPLVTVGDAVQWTYVVTNTGNAVLTDVTVTDDRVAAADIDCSATGSNVVPGPLAPGASFTCVATGEAALGQYENLGAVTGTAPETTDVDGETVPGVEVDDEDPSHYFGVEPSIDIEKATNSRDADTPTGPYVAVGGQVRWTYVVTNTGNAALTAVTVTDDLVAAAQIDCDGTGSNVIAGPLAQGESFTCVANGTAAPGQYTNLGTVTGIGPQTTDVAGNPVPGVEVDDTDRSHYFGALPGIVIEKATNTHDADEPTGPVINRDGAVRWTYVVTNTGNVTLTDVTVTDDMVASTEITCEGTDGNIIAELAPGASVQCEADGTAIVGQYANLGAVTGTAPAGTDVEGDPVPRVEVTDDDPSHYFGVIAAVDIEKSTNGQDADTPTGPLVSVGGDVRWTYVVTNTGTSDLTQVTVIDDMVAATGIDCDGTGSNIIAGPLAPGASFTCVATGTATAGQYANLGSVTGIGPQVVDVDGTIVPGLQVDDEDPSHYFGIQPAVDIEKATNGQDADTPTGPSVTIGGAVEWTYVVTNTGNTALTDVTVTDDVEAAASIDCDGTGSNVVPGPLQPGESFTCTASGTATAGQYTNLGTVTGTAPPTTDVDGNPVEAVIVTDEDRSHYVGVELPPVIKEVGDFLGRTGGGVGILPVAAGALLAGGILLLVLRRRKSEHSAAGKVSQSA